MSAATATTKRLVLALAGLLYVGVFGVFFFFENPGLGIGNFFYVPVCLVALVTDEALGALAGVVAAGIYVGAVVLAPGVPSAQALTAASGIRLVTYAIVGALMGFYASRNRQLVDRLRELAGRDFITGCGNARTFDDELAKRCAAGGSFALVLVDADGLNDINQVHGHAAGNAALKRIGEVLTQHAEPGDVIARIGGDEFALLTSLPADQIAALQARTNRNALCGESLRDLRRHLRARRRADDHGALSQGGRPSVRRQARPHESRHRRRAARADGLGGPACSAAGATCQPERCPRPRPAATRLRDRHWPRSEEFPTCDQVAKATWSLDSDLGGRLQLRSALAGPRNCRAALDQGRRNRADRDERAADVDGRRRAVHRTSRACGSRPPARTRKRGPRRRRRRRALGSRSSRRKPCLPDRDATELSTTFATGAKKSDMPKPESANGTTRSM